MVYLLIEVKDQGDVGVKELRRFLLNDSIEIYHHTLSVIEVEAAGKEVHPTRLEILKDGVVK